MKVISILSKVAIASAFTIATPFALASDDCVKPKVKGYSASEMSCIGEGLVKAYNHSTGGERTIIIADKNGKIIVSEGKYNDVFEFSEGLSGVVSTDYKAGFINKTGNVIIPTIYEPAMAGEGGSFVEVNRFKEGLVSIAKKTNDGDEKWGFINKTGTAIIPFKYVYAGNFGSGVAPVAIIKNDKYVWGYVDKSAKTIIPFSYEYAGSFSFSENVAVVVKNEKYGVIDTKGKMIVPAKYHHINDFSNGLAAVFQRGTPIKNSDSVRGKYGFIDKTGKVIVPIKYDTEYYDMLELPHFKNGKAKIIITKNGQETRYCINKKGTKVNC